MGTFKIDVDNLAWIKGDADDPENLCLHGHATVFIGTRKFEYDATVSATALYLLKTLTEDHIMNQDNQMLPCCGHFIIPNDTLDNVTIIGCDNGIDWSVLHQGDSVILELDDSTREAIPLFEYKDEVFKFADKIEEFYKQCSPQIISDDFEKDGYTAFWNEWHRRRNG